MRLLRHQASLNVLIILQTLHPKCSSNAVIKHFSPQNFHFRIKRVYARLQPSVFPPTAKQSMRRRMEGAKSGIDNVERATVREVFSQTESCQQPCDIDAPHQSISAFKGAFVQQRSRDGGDY